VRFGDAVLTVQLAAERVHDDLCPKHAEGAPWHQCGWRPSVLATADALDAIMAARTRDEPHPERAGALALHGRSCRDSDCGPQLAAQHAEVFGDAALSLVVYVDDLRGQERPAPPVDDSSAVENRRGKVRSDHPETSAKAAVAVAPKTGTQRMAILQLLLDAPFGLTDPEIGDETGLAMNSVRPRRVELVEGEWAENSGRVRMVNGHEHTTWQATAKARAHYGVAQPSPVR
jgi:hypothetical protein